MSDQANKDSFLKKRSVEKVLTSEELGKKVKIIEVAPEIEEQGVKRMHKRVKLRNLFGNQNKKTDALTKEITKKAMKHLNNFKKSMQLSSQIPVNERIRQRIRESFFYGLVYGFEEMKALAKQKKIDIADFQNGKKLIAMKDREQIDYVKGLTLEVEANLYHRFKRDVKKSSEYSTRSRMISMNLKHKKNFGLRSRVLTKAVAAGELCTMSADDLAPNSSKAEQNQQRDYFMESRLIVPQEKCVAKSRKGEIEIQEDNDKYSPPKALDTQGFNFSASKIKSSEKKDTKTKSFIKKKKIEGETEDERLQKKKQLKVLESLSYDKFRSKVEHRFEQYLPEEYVEELSAALPE